MPTPSIAKELFDRIKGAPDKIAFLTSFADPKDPRTEEEWLEFKCPPQGKGLKEIWSTVLSGFANSSGGVLVWGISAKKGEGDKKDCARDICPVENPDEFKSQLMQLQREATDPPVPEVVIEAFTDTASKKGVVVCFVPESKFRPHRAEYVHNNPYYLRISDNFLVMPVAVLRGMFYPRSQSRLRTKIIPRGIRNDLGACTRWNWGVRIENAGTATARDASVLIKSNFHLDKATIDQDCQISRMEPDFETIFCGRPIHPGGFHDIITYREAAATLSSRQKTTFEFKLYANDSEPVFETLAFTRQETEASDGIGKYGDPMEGPSAKLATLD